MPTKTDIEACLGAYGRCFEEQQWDQFGLAPFATGSGNALIGFCTKNGDAVLRGCVHLNKFECEKAEDMHDKFEMG